MAKNLLNLAVSALAVTSASKGTSTVTQAVSANSIKNKTATGLKSSLGSNLNLSLGELTDENSKFLATTVTATDPNINAVQSLVDAAKKTISPKMPNTIAGLNATSIVAAAGVSALAGKIPSLNTAINSQFGNLGVDQVSKRMGYATNVAMPGVPTSISNITTPLSSVLNSFGATSPLMNTVSSFNTLSNTSSPLGKLSAGVNLINSATQLAKSSPQDIAKGLAGAAISNVIGNKLNVLDNVGLGGVFGNAISKTFGQTLGAFGGTQNIKLYNPSDWINPDVEAFATKAFQKIENITNDLTANYSSVESVLTKLNIPLKSGSDGSRKLGNKLREYNSYNYIISLGILSPKELNFPDEYVKNGLQRIICKSGGGQTDIKMQTQMEEDLGGHMEFFIDNVSIESAVAPNQNTGITLGTSVTFDIIEPYSMGQFLEVIRESAKELKFGSFQNLPFCLKIEFAGYDALGNLTANEIVPSYLPIMITNVEFDVDGSGSKYSCRAVIYSEVAFKDGVDQIKTDISASGRLVHEVLETSEDSITASINSLFENAEDKQLISGYDRYLILFPHDSGDIYDALDSVNASKTEVMEFYDREGRRRNKSLTTLNPENSALEFRQNEAVMSGRTNQAQDIQAQIFAKRTASKSAKYFRNLKIWGSRPENINSIGLSAVLDDTARAKNTINKAQRYELANDGPGQVEETNLPEFATKQFYQYGQGDRVSSIITDVTIDCQYVHDLQKTEAGMIDYFKIEQMVFIEDEEEINPDLGRPRMTYVYCVVPYKIDESKIQGAQEAPTAIPERKASADKEYNYIYSGKNEDILDFNINFNNAFTELVLVDFNKGAVSAGEATLSAQRDKDQKYEGANSREKNELTSTVELGIKQESNFLNGAKKSTNPDELAKRNRAEEHYSNLINSPLNMVTADLSIWGDPYYLPSDAGNQRKKLVGKNLSIDGRADFRYQDLSIVINFRTPLDYPQLNGVFTMGMPELVKPFSGLFNCWGITHTFNNGQFTQNLSLMRVPNQTNTPTGTGVIAGTNSRFVDGRIVGGL